MEGGLTGAGSASFLAELAGAIDAIGTADFFTALLSCIGAPLEAEASMILLFRRDGSPSVVADALKADERKYLYGDYLSGVYLLSPFYQAALKCRAPDVVTLSQIAPDGFRRSEYFRVYFSRIGVRDMAGLFIPSADGQIFHLSFSRGLTQPPFAVADLALLGRLLPVAAACLRKHLERASPRELPLASRDSPAKNRMANGLTTRERGVMEALLAGHSAKSVSRSLGISVETVRVHRRHLYAKLGVKSQAELFARYLAQVNSSSPSS
jgi:DNA-binding CsgD family transcriptional regulator